MHSGAGDALWGNEVQLYKGSRVVGHAWVHAVRMGVHGGGVYAWMHGGDVCMGCYAGHAHVWGLSVMVRCMAVKTRCCLRAGYSGAGSCRTDSGVRGSPLPDYLAKQAWVVRWAVHRGGECTWGAGDTLHPFPHPPYLLTTQYPRQDRAR